MPLVQPDYSDQSSSALDRGHAIAAALEQRRIGDGEDSWVVHVFGVHGDERDLWIQVSDRPDGDDGLVLHLSPWASVQQAFTALAAVHPQERRYPHVVPVMISA